MKYQLPTVVRGRIEEDGQHTQILDKPSLDLQQVRFVYKNKLGGGEGHQWARRILRQRNLLKAANVGDVAVNETVDLLYGPTLIGGFRKEDSGDVTEALMELGEPAVIVPDDKGSWVFVGVEHKNPETIGFGFTKRATQKNFNLDWQQAILLKEDSRVGKAHKGAVLYKSYYTDVSIDVHGYELEQPLLLQGGDSAIFESQFAKVDDRHGVVIGWAIICKQDGEDYFDTQADHITENCMFEASLDFMQSPRTMGEMHIQKSDAVHKGTVVFALPLDTEIQKALGISCSTTGLAVGVKPDDPEVLAKFRSGEYTGFSIGGHYIPEFIEEVES